MDPRSRRNTRSLSMITGMRPKQNAAPSETNATPTSSNGPSAKDLSFVLNNFKEIEKWSGPTKRILFSVVNTANYASYSKFDIKIINLRRSMVAMAVASIFLSIYANEIRSDKSFPGISSNFTVDNVCLAIVSILTATMTICNLVIKYWKGREDSLSMHLKHNGTLQPAWAIFANMVYGGLFSIEHLVELLIIVPHMPPFLALTFSYETSYYGVPIINTYRMESLAAMWTLLRLYKVVILVRDEVLQQYSNKRLIEQNTKITIHSVFATKLLMENHPVKCVVFISFVFCFSAGYWLKVVEGGINQRFESYLDCMWCLVITFWTIGYGDLFPTTLLGRFVAVTTGFLGIVTAAIITATLANAMQFSVKEFFAKSTLDREVYEKQYITEAARFLQRRWRHSKFSSRICCPSKKWQNDLSQFVSAQRTYRNWKASLFNVEETVNRSRMFISRSRMHLHNLATKVVTDEATLISLGINSNDSKEQKLRESMVTHNLRAKKEQIIIKNIRHIGHEVASITSKVSNKPVSEVTAAVEASVSSAGAGKSSIFSGDIKIARSATEALKVQLTRNVELLSSLNALLFPQPGADHSMEFSRCCGCFVRNGLTLSVKRQHGQQRVAPRKSDSHAWLRFDDAPRSSNTHSVNDDVSIRRASATPGSAKNMRMSATYSPKIAAAAMPDLQSSASRGSISAAASSLKSKSQEVFDESGNAVPLANKMQSLPAPNSFSAQLLPGKLMQHPDGTVKAKRHSMYT